MIDDNRETEGYATPELLLAGSCTAYSVGSLDSAASLPQSVYCTGGASATCGDAAVAMHFTMSCIRDTSRPAFESN